MNGRDVVRLVLLSAPRRPIVTKHAHRTFGVPLRVNCSCATRKQLRGPLLSVKNASPCADLELATHNGHPVYFAETFIDPGRFRGTCYRAANWQLLGLTTGRGKDDQTNQPNRPIKEVLGLALTPRFRQFLSEL